MPRLFPDRFPEELRADRAGAAERDVYDALAGDLDDDWTVFHRVRWLDRGGAGGGFTDGEADFVVAHPARGLLVLEVKGGRVRVDHGRWVSVDRDGVEHEIRNPYAQASHHYHILRRKLESLPGWAGRPVPIGHAVVLPHVSKSGVAAPDASLDVTLDADDLTRPRAALERVFGHWRHQPDAHWRAEGVRVLERMFVHRDFARVRLGTRVRQHEVELLRLTERQAAILDTLSEHRRAAITGCAGSGKTMLAVEKARRLAGEGFRVLVTCFNRALADFIRLQLPAGMARPGTARGPEHAQADLFGPRVDVEHFHRLAASWARRAGVALADPGDDDEARRRLFEEALPEALAQAAPRLPERYDAILVDEGQDFREEWWVALLGLLADPAHGVLYVFYDDNQAIYTAGAALPVDTPPFHLTRNCRNTREIHRWVGRFYRGHAEPDPAGPEGREPELLRYGDERGLREHLRRTLHRLVHEEQVPERQIVVLSPHGPRTSALWRDPVFGNLRLTDAWPPAPNHVECTTIQAFKGLEREVVVLAEVGGTARRPEELLYVGGSRAKSHLVVIQEE